MARGDRDYAPCQGEAEEGSVINANIKHVFLTSVYAFVLLRTAKFALTWAEGDHSATIVLCILSGRGESRAC